MKKTYYYLLYLLLPSLLTGLLVSMTSISFLAFIVTAIVLIIITVIAIVYFFNRRPCNFSALLLGLIIPPMPTFFVDQNRKAYREQYGDYPHSADLVVDLWQVIRLHVEDCGDTS